MSTLIRNADWVVGWDGEHRYLRNADVVFDRTIEFVGHGAPAADTEIDGAGLMVMPGLVDVHSHPTSEPGNRGILEDAGSPQFGQSGLYEYLPVFRLEPDAARAATHVALAEMMQSGVTTVVDISGARDGWVDDLAATGMRAVVAPSYRSAFWYTDDGRSVNYRWDEAAGERGLAAAVGIVEQARAHPSNRIDAILSPAQIDTCTDALLQASMDAARELDTVMTVHACQSVVEFQEMTRRHGLTPIEHLDRLGVLNERTLIGHGIFLNDHPWLHWPGADDFARLVDAGAAVAHCPVNFVRRGIALNWLGRYVDAGVRVGIGTDTFPHNMIDEMRTACHAARLAGGAFGAGRTTDAFNAATIGGAQAIGRNDIGRLAPGCQADLVLVDLTHPYMRPVRDPLRSLVHSASDRAVRDVYVAGQRIVSAGVCEHVPLDAALDELTAAQQVCLDNIPQRDWGRRNADQMSPLALPGEADD